MHDMESDWNVVRAVPRVPMPIVTDPLPPVPPVEQVFRNNHGLTGRHAVVGAHQVDASPVAEGGDMQGAVVR